MPTREILDRLVSVERDAERVVADAAAEADRRLAEAGDRADRAYRETSEREARRIEDARVKAISAIEETRTREIEAYRAALAAAPLDEIAFRAVCETWLSAWLSGRS